ncbi:hypothetical protein A8139_00655 [Marinomonas primoryensis]|uniref:Phage tail assembly chaperone-like domain-containing protein n=1 Tax=Marinomonas primoryensis TaxID=178399 RepID=A0A2Z4PNC6_9GAMM|nr:phage tail assembly chaperone [Marinomonas primoryensis]AWX98573.1 hypothetical protein A8139_00150 [Marinomonas primoryensis]AWX98663.1 hypothetical protein A8139_00655 [Marinomonas primoryensis]
MPYALGDKISISILDGGIEITDEEYVAAVTAKISGRNVYVHGGSLLIESIERREIYSTESGSVKEIAANAPLPDFYTDIPPPTHDHEWDGGEWIISAEKLSASVRKSRDALLDQLTWRYERHAREMRLGVETTDSLSALDTYAQALADVPQEEGFPTDIEWPEVPA